MTLPTLKESRELMTELDAYIGKKLREIAEKAYDDWRLVKFTLGYNYLRMDVEDTETWNFRYERDDKGKKTWLLNDIAVIIDNDCAYCPVEMPIHEGSAMHDPLRALLLLAKAQGVKRYQEALPRKCKPQPKQEEDDAPLQNEEEEYPPCEDMELTVTMAQPPSALSPNGRAHWRVKAREAQAVRRRAMMFAQTATHTARVPNFLPVSYRIVWHYKGRMPDDDNVVARCKAALDGCCDVFNIDDRVLKLRGVEKVHALHQPLCGYVEIIFNDGKEDA